MAALPILRVAPVVSFNCAVLRSSPPGQKPRLPTRLPDGLLGRFEREASEVPSRKPNYGLTQKFHAKHRLVYSDADRDAPKERQCTGRQRWRKC